MPMRALLAPALLALLALPALGLPAAAPCDAQEARLDFAALALSPAMADSHPCTGKVRPGAPLIINDAFGCTLAWILRDDAGALYATTAGHCVPDYASDRLVVPGVGDIGDPVFLMHGGLGEDFALIRLDPAVHARVEPSLCHWGGAQAVGTDLDPDIVVGAPVLHHGFGYVWGQNEATRARAGTLVAGGGFHHSLWEGLVGPGDSGSPLETATGKVVGVITHTVFAPSPAPPVGLVLSAATRLSYAMEQAEAALGVDLELVQGVPVDPTGLTVP